MTGVLILVSQKQTIITCHISHIIAYHVLILATYVQLTANNYPRDIQNLLSTLLLISEFTGGIILVVTSGLTGCFGCDDEFDNELWS